MKKLITVLAVLGMVFALAPAAQADTLYQENFVGTSEGGALTQIDWEDNSGGRIGLWTVAGAGGTVPTPDGDNWYATVSSDSTGLWPGFTSERTILAAERVGTQFLMDWAVNRSGTGMRFVAKVGGTWYGSDLFGDAITSDTLMVGANTKIVAQWVTDQAVDVETANWYAWAEPTNPEDNDAVVDFPPPGHPGLDGDEWSSTSESLPAGDITSFGFSWNNFSWDKSFASDNFRVTAGTPAATGTLILLK